MVFLIYSNNQLLPFCLSFSIVYAFLAVFSYLIRYFSLNSMLCLEFPNEKCFKIQYSLCFYSGKNRGVSGKSFGEQLLTELRYFVLSPYREPVASSLKWLEIIFEEFVEWICESVRNNLWGSIGDLLCNSCVTFTANESKLWRDGFEKRSVQYSAPSMNTFEKYKVRNGSLWINHSFGLSSQYLIIVQVDLRDYLLGQLKLVILSLPLISKLIVNTNGHD